MAIEALLPIIIPLVAYVISGIVMVLKVIGQIKDMAKKSSDDKAETTSEISKVEDQLKLAVQENAELRKEVHRLANKVDKIMED